MNPKIKTRSAAPQKRSPSTVDEKAEIVAAAARKLLADGSLSPGPAIRTETTRGRSDRRDVRSMARDAGFSGAALDRREEAEEDFARVLRGERLSDEAEARRRERAADARIGLGVERRQFSEMRGGRRVTNRTLARAMSEDEILEAGPSGIRFGEPDRAHLYTSGVGQLVSRWMTYLASSNAGGVPDGMRAAEIAFQRGESPLLVRTLAESALDTGGVLVPDPVAEDLIELQYAATPFLQGNPIRMQLPNGSAVLPRMATGSAVGWIGENANAPKTSPTFDAPRLSLRTLAGLVPYSNRLARHSPQDVARLVLNDLVAGAAVKLDLALIRGAGTAHEPLGIENQCPAANKYNSAGTSVANITSDTGKANRLLEENNIMPVRRFWLMAPRTRWALMTARDGNNNLIWAAEMAMGQFMGSPFGVTTNIPVNLGGGLNESKLYLVEMNEEVFAEGLGEDGMRFDSRDGVAYHDGSAVVSAFSQDQSVARLTQTADLVSRRNGLNIAIIEALTIA